MKKGWSPESPGRSRESGEESTNMGTKEARLTERIVAQAERLAEQKSKPANGRRVKHNRNTDADEAAARAKLESKGGGATEAARKTGAPLSTLREWASGRRLGPAAHLKYGVVKETLAVRLEDLAHQMISAIPEKIEATSLKDLGAVLAQVIDKIRLLREEPTAITDSINRREMLERLIDRTMQEFPGMTREEVIEAIRDIEPRVIKFLS
jgi:hypothetical protein